MSIDGGAVQAVVSPRAWTDVHEAVAMPAALCLGLLRQAARIHRAGLKSYGLLVAEPGAAGAPVPGARRGLFGSTEEPPQRPGPPRSVPRPGRLLPAVR